MLSAVLLLDAVQAFTLERAKATPPAELIRALIGEDHEPIEEVIIHPIGMEAPSNSLQEVTLVGVPENAPDKEGWCRRINLSVKLVPLTEGANAYVNALPTRVDSIASRQYYRLNDGNCSSGSASFFSVQDESRDAQFDLFDRLMAARDIARRKEPLPFTLQCIDEDGARSPTFGGDRCHEGAGQALLANLPLERTRWLLPMREVIVGNTAETPQKVLRDAEIMMSDDALNIDVTVVENAGQITAIRIKRHIPYPF